MAITLLALCAATLLGCTSAAPDPKRAPSAATTQTASATPPATPNQPPASPEPTLVASAVPTRSPAPAASVAVASPASVTTTALSTVTTSRPSATSTRPPTPTATGVAVAAVQAAFAALPGASAAIAVLPDGERVAQDAERQLPSASVIKLWVAGAALAEADAGRLDLAEMYTVQPRDVASGTGILNLKDNAGRTLSYAELIDTMLVYSDNTATNLVVTRIGGFGAVNAYARENGYPRTLMQRRLGELDPAHDNYTSAADCLRFFQRLDARAVVSAAASERILASLQKRRRLEDRAYDYVGRDLPASAAYIHISGLGPSVRNDIGAYTARDGRTGFVVVLLSALPDEAAGEAALARVARQVYDAAP